MSTLEGAVIWRSEGCWFNPPGQKKLSEPKMAKYEAFNGLNNKTLVRKLARIKQMPSCGLLCHNLLVYFCCSELFGEKAETGKFTYIFFLYAKVKS